MQFSEGQRVRLPGDVDFREVDGAISSGDGSLTLFVNGPAGLRKVTSRDRRQPDSRFHDTDGKAMSGRWWFVFAGGLWIGAPRMRVV